MNNSIIAQGAFTQPATAIAQTIIVPPSLDSLEVWNWTQAGGTAGNGYFFYWQLPVPPSIMGDGTQGIYQASGMASAVTVGQTAVNAFLLYDPSTAVPGAQIALTAYTAANPGVVTTGSTAGISAGSVVRLTSLNNQTYLNGIEASVGYGTLNGTTFSTDYINTTGSTPSTSGDWALVEYPGMIYPWDRTITNITAAAQAVLTFSVDHGYTVGQKVRLTLLGGSSAWGNYSLLNGNVYTIVAVDSAVGNGHNTITIDANTIGYGTFLTYWQANGSFYGFAKMNPVGENTSFAFNSLAPQTPVINGVQIYNTESGVLSDSRTNTAFLGMTLASGALMPAGVANDVVFWKAYKSVSPLF